MCNKKEKLLKKVEELKQQIEKLDNEYPKYMLAINVPKCRQFIVKFTNTNTGKVVATAEDSGHSINNERCKWVVYNNTSEWKEVNNPHELYDKDLVECWTNGFTHVRTLKFYDAENYSTFSVEGNRGSAFYDNYRKLMPWEYPEWVIEAQKTLED